VSQARGFSNGFEADNSTTWEADKNYRLLIAANLTQENNAMFGTDKATLGAVNGNVSVSDVLVGAVPSQDFYLGMLGLDASPINFTDTTQSQPSLIHQLRNDKQIPSLSFGYTAGASYSR
jgi:hypothetical protein